MKTFIIVRAPSDKHGDFLNDRILDLASEVKENYQFAKQGLTECVCGQDSVHTNTLWAIMEEIGLKHPRFDPLLHCQYRASSIEFRVFELLDYYFQKCDTLIIVASSEIAQYSLDYAKATFRGDIFHEFVSQGEGILCLEGVGSTQIIPKYRSHLHVVGKRRS